MHQSCAGSYWRQHTERGQDTRDELRQLPTADERIRQGKTKESVLARDLPAGEPTWLGLSAVVKAAMKPLRVLITIPHVFAPREGSLYSSQTESKRMVKTAALYEACIGNLGRHRLRHWIHASLGYKKPVITRELTSSIGVDLTIQVYTPTDASLAGSLPTQQHLEIIDANLDDYTQIPSLASRRALEQSHKYDLIGYMEDDLAIEDPEFFLKIQRLVELTGGNYAFIPHRCEAIPGLGDVILSGDPDGGRPDLFWATNECIQIDWPLGSRYFYRATNPHSGCYFLSRRQAQQVREYWQNRQWIPDFTLSGPLEQAGSGFLLPVLKLMKPIPDHYRFLMVRHQDELWRRHAFEQDQPVQ
jgi:hypothetical protein